MPLSAAQVRDALSRFRDPLSGEYPGRAVLAELDTLWAEVQELRAVKLAWAADREREEASKAAKREAKSHQQRARRAVARAK